MEIASSARSHDAGSNFILTLSHPLSEWCYIEGILRQDTKDWNFPGTSGWLFTINLAPAWRTFLYTTCSSVQTTWRCTTLNPRSAFFLTMAAGQQMMMTIRCWRKAHIVHSRSLCTSDVRLPCLSIFHCWLRISWSLYSWWCRGRGEITRQTWFLVWAATRSLSQRTVTYYLHSTASNRSEIQERSVDRSAHILVQWHNDSWPCV